MSEFLRRLRILLRRERFDSDLEEEMQTHLEMEAEENERNDIAPAEARRRARRQFGNATLLKERSREMWGWAALEGFIQDSRYALRTLGRSPAFVAIAVLSLALGIGVNTAIFSIVDGLLLRPLAVPQSDRLVSLQHRAPSSALYDSMSLQEYLHYRDHNDAFAGLAAHKRVSVTVGEGDRSTSLAGEIVSANYFDVLGLRPVLGRWFAPGGEMTPGASPVVVLGYGLWQRQFGGDPAVLGKQMTINRQRFTVIGVAPRGFAGLPAGYGVARAEFWVPVSAVGEVLAQIGGVHLLQTWGNHWIYVTGRLKPGLGIAQAELALRPLSDQLRDQWSTVWGAMRSWSDNPSGWTAALVPTSQTRIAPMYRQPVSAFLWILGGIVGLVLLMACVNVAGLIITRALKRRREIAVRLSLGADRSRIVRQFLIESLLLAGAGCAAGLAIAHWTARYLASFRTPFIPVAVEAALDNRVLLFAATLSILCAVLSGLLPARQASECDLASAMKGDGGGGLSVGRPSRLRGALVAIQVALSLVFIAGAGLFIRTLMNARAADITVDPGNVLLTQLDLRKRDYDSTRGQLFFDTLLDRLHSLPGVKSAALVLVVPLGGTRGGTNIKTVDGEVQVDFNAVSPRYFETVGIPVVRGHSFTERDRAESQGVVLINEQFAKRFFPGQDPIGKWIDLTFPNRPKAQIIGIVRDGRFRSVREPVMACFYLPQAQFHWPFYSGHIALEVRTAGQPSGLAPAVRREILTLDKGLDVGEMLTLRSHREASLAQERLIAALLMGFAVLAVVLAAIGIYGVVSFAVAQRTREIGLRMALGANAASVLRLVLSHSLALMLAGIAIGLPVTFALTRFVSSLLFGVEATDPVTFGGSAALLAGVALLAACLPARRATRIDPMESLRHE